jgi:hypothetical protein
VSELPMHGVPITTRPEPASRFSSAGEAIASALLSMISATSSGVASLLESSKSPQPSSELPKHGVPMTCGLGTGAARMAVVRNVMRVMSESCMMAGVDQKVA